MPRLTTAYSNFSAGELSPKLRGRFNLEFYFNGVERMQNFIAETQGSARFRNGFKYVLNTKDNNEAVLIPFQFNDEQAYILELTDQKMRVYRNEGIVVDSSQNITNVTQANPAVLTYVGTDPSNGTDLFIDSITGMTELNGGAYKVANVNAGANTFEIQDINGVNIDSTGFTAYSSGGTITPIVEFSTPWLTADLFQLKFAQTADTMYVVHPDHAPRKITRTSHTSWTVSTFSRTSDPFTGVNNYPSAVGFYEQRLVYGGTNNEPQTLFFSKSADYDNMTIGVDADDGMEYTIASEQVNAIRWLAPTEKQLIVGTFGGTFKVTGGTDDTAVTPTNISIRPSGSYGCADQTPLRGDNQVIFTQRGKRTIRTFEFDALADSFVSVDRNLLSDHMTIGDIKQTVIQTGRPDIIWAVKSNGELIGLTFKSKEQVSGWHRHSTGDSNDNFESVAALPVDTGSDQLWIATARDINGSTVRFVEFQEDVTEFPEKIDYYTGQANEATDTESFLFAMFEAQKFSYHLDAGDIFDGSALGLAASATLTPGATTGTSITFTTSAAIFSATDVGRELWNKGAAGRAMITGYTSSTQVTCTIKVDFPSTDAIAAGSWYLTASTISGLNHLEGETIKVVTDGGTHPDVTVASGAFTLNYQASVIQFGIGYSGAIKSMNLETGSQNGPAQSKPVNVHRMGIRFQDSLGTKYGTDLYNLDSLTFRSTADKMNRPVPLFSGYKVAPVLDSWQLEKHMFIVQDSPLPCTIQVLVPHLTVNDT